MRVKRPFSNYHVKFCWNKQLLVVFGVARGELKSDKFAFLMPFVCIIMIACYIYFFHLQQVEDRRFISMVSKHVFKVPISIECFTWQCILQVTKEAISIFYVQIMQRFIQKYRCQGCCYLLVIRNTRQQYIVALKHFAPIRRIIFYQSTLLTSQSLINKRVHMSFNLCQFLGNI